MKKYLIISSVENEEKQQTLLDVKYAGSLGEKNKAVKAYSKMATVSHRVFEIWKESVTQDAITLIEVASKMLRHSETERVKK